MPCQTLPKNGFVLPSNEEISAALIERFDNMIRGIARKMGVDYRLTTEEREDIIQSTFLKIMKLCEPKAIKKQMDWRSIFRKNTHWIMRHAKHHPRAWEVQETAFMLRNFAKVVVQRAALDALWDLKSNGLKGLGLHKTPIGALPQYESFDNIVEPSADGITDRTAASQIALMAQQLMSAEEWLCVSLTYGFEGEELTPAQAARQVGYPRKRVRSLVESGMEKMRSAVGNR
jgi:RNA polymerase sigma factor (sigma-70 family)